MVLIAGVPASSGNPEWGTSSPGAWPSIDWAHYHNYTEIVEILVALNATFPEVVDVFSIGNSWQGSDIYAVRLTNESDPRPKPEVFFVGYHHAREPISAELPLYFVVEAVTAFGSNQTVTELLNHSEIYVVVALNVDGFELFEANDWQRKNARPTEEDYDGLLDEDPPEDENQDGFIEQLIDYSNPASPVFIRWEGADNDGDGNYAEDWTGGVDLNRNYDYRWTGGSSNPRSEIYKGPAPFSEPETQALRDFVLAHDFRYALSFHSGVELILYPWGYTSDPAPDEAQFIDIAQDLSTLSGGTPYQQSSDLYYSYGVWDDWMYGVAGVYALTCEVFANETYEGVTHPGPYPNTVWEGGLKYWFNPSPDNIEATIQRWLPVFFYITNRTVNETAHDVAITDVQLQRTVISEGYVSRVNISLQNRCFFDEAVNVTIYVNETALDTQTVTLETTAVLTFSWNTTGFPTGNYTLRAYAWPVPNETSTGDNTLDAPQSVCVTLLGDVDADFDVDIYDMVDIAGVYGQILPPFWPVPPPDIDGDGDVDIYDVVLAAAHYGEQQPTVH
jgi:hypothetical protein